MTTKNIISKMHRVEEGALETTVKINGQEYNARFHGLSSDAIGLSDSNNNFVGELFEEENKLFVVEGGYAKYPASYNKKKLFEVETIEVQ